MTPHRLELADVFRAHQQEFLEQWGHVLSPQQHRAFRDICNCRTAALGGHLDECDQCGHRAISYNSCRNRSCPKCLATAQAQWLDERQEELLPVDYFHVVFTLPQQIAVLALHNGRQIYSILFRAAAETLLKIAADPKYLGADIGFMAVLHTWGQNLHLHPHVHCVVPGGGISPDGSRWIFSRKKFFLPCKVLSRQFRRTFLAYLQKAFRKGNLRFYGESAKLAAPDAFEAFCRQASNIEWVVYAKPPFGGPAQVLKYLARYTHRVAISNRRLVSLEDGKVSFQWKDYADGDQTKTMTLDAIEFIRRFLLHVPPAGFVRIRHYGFLANRVRKEKLAQCRSLLETRSLAEERDIDRPRAKESREDLRRCPVCGIGKLVLVSFVVAEHACPSTVGRLDSS